MTKADLITALQTIHDVPDDGNTWDVIIQNPGSDLRCLTIVNLTTNSATHEIILHCVPM